MKILIVGSDSVFAIENFYVKYLNQVGVFVELFPAQHLFYEYYHKNILNKILFRTGFSSVIKTINQVLIKQVDEFKPDILWVFKGMEVLPSTLQLFKQQGIKLVNYNPDNPFIFSGTGSGNSNVKNSIELYDLHLTYHSEVKREIEKSYNINTELLPFGFDVSDELYNTCLSQKEIIKACFLGNPDKYRGQFLKELAEKGVLLDVYGNNWNKFANHPNIKIFETVRGDDFWLTLSKYRVQLNLIRPHTLDTHNMRSFEIPGIGGIQLAPQSTDHLIYFEEDKEIFIYSGVRDCVVKIKKILGLSEQEAKKIRLQARKRSLESNYTYKARAIKALAYLKELYE